MILVADNVRQGLMGIDGLHVLAYKSTQWPHLRVSYYGEELKLIWRDGTVVVETGKHEGRLFGRPMRFSADYFHQNANQVRIGLELYRNRLITEFLDIFKDTIGQLFSREKVEFLVDYFQVDIGHVPHVAMRVNLDPFKDPAMVVLGYDPSSGNFFLRASLQGIKIQEESSDRASQAVVELALAFKNLVFRKVYQ